MVNHGRSDIYKRDTIFFRHADYAKIILALLDSLKLNSVNAIGASSGGMTLLYLNTIQPKRFKSVITIGAQIYYSKQAREWITNYGMNKFIQYATAPHGAERAMFLTRQFLRLVNQYGDPLFTPDMLSTIKASWLVVQGDNDEPVPLEQALDMHQYIQNSRLWVIPDGGHLPHLEARYQSEFLKVSLEFLNGKWDKNE